MGKQASPVESAHNKSVEESMIEIFDEDSMLINKFMRFLELR